MGNKQANTTNRLMDQSMANYNTQRSGFQQAAMSGLGNAQANSDAAFQAALSGYQGLLGRNADMANRAIAAGNKSAEGIMGMAGPGNPWAGVLGQQIRARGNSVIPGMFEAVRDEMTRTNNLQGGYNPGYTAQMSKMTRDSAREAANNVLNTEVTLGEKIAAARAAQAAFALQQRGMAGRARQGGFGSASGFGRNSLAALQGIYNLRGQTPGEVQMYLNAGLGNMGQGQELANQALGQRAAYNPNVSGWEKALGIAGGLAGGFAPFMGGFGGRGTPSYFPSNFYGR